MTVNPVKIAVVIPYFQRTPGILRRALASVAAQDIRAEADVGVIVVDDSSPWPATEEIAGYEGLGITVLRQPNGGPGAARNLALDNLPSNTDFVAFLDSDDEWLSDHLSNAVKALGSEFGLYICDHTRFDFAGSWFSIHDTTAGWLDEAQRTNLPVQEIQPGRLVFDRSYLITRMVETYVGQTSTIVYRLEGNSLRFDPSLRGAGEDALMFLQLANANRTVISLSCDVHCGNGVNIYYGALSWKDARAVDRYGNMLLFLNRLAELDFLKRADRSLVAAQRRKFSRAYSYLFGRALLLRSLPNFGLLGRLLRETPSTVLLMPLRFLAVLPTRKAEAQSW